MPSITDVAARLSAADLPVIFLDTCILLDVIRAIKRRHANCVEHAAALYTAATAAPVRCSVVVSHLVHHEWGTNQQALLDEASRHLTEIHEQSGYFHDACGVFGIVPGFPRANYAGLGLAVRMHDLSRQLLDSAAVIDPDDECSGRAMTRVTYNLPPSKEGREAKDCAILEEYLEVCRQLQQAGFRRKLVFCTSNTNDYCDRSGLHVNLATDFAAVGLRFTANLSWGYHDVTH